MAAVTAPAATPTNSLGATLTRVKDASRAFARMTLKERIALATSMLRGYHEIAEDCVMASCRAKGIPLDSPVVGEEWISGPLVVVRNLRLLIQSMKDIERHGAPQVDSSWVSTLPDGRLSVRVFPQSMLDSSLLPRHVADVHFQPGVTAANLKEHQASFYRAPRHSGRLCLVLGAGNINAIPPCDVLYKMFVEGTVCVVKTNPVNAYLGAFMERAFRSAVDQGFFAVVYGGAEEGAYSVNHPAVDEVHITGSDKTHDLLVWGPPAEQASRKARGEPLLQKTMTSELGNISPVLVIPGPYSDSEVQAQGDSVAGAVANNGSFNCNAAKLVITSESWGQRQPFLNAIERGLRRAPLRTAYYPGANDRFKAFTEGRPGLRLVGEPAPGELPYALIPNVNPSDASDRIFHQEPWCSVLSETALPAPDFTTFLNQAVTFLNEKLWGTLCATVIVHPSTLDDPTTGPLVEKAIRSLAYGTVAVNTWPAVGFALGSTPWGGHPSATLADIQSGIGWVHNTFMFENIEKCVIRGPLKMFPLPPWAPGHRSLAELGKRLVDFEAAPSWLKLPLVGAAAVRA